MTEGSQTLSPAPSQTASPTISVICGANGPKPAPLSGRPITDIRAALAEEMNITADHLPFVNGERVAEESTVPQGATLEFISDQDALG